MILVDTSVWVQHLREGNKNLKALLENGEVLCHPFIIGELACGNIRNRREILSLLSRLPTASEAEHEEVLRYIETNRLMGKGLGYVDMHLYVPAVLTGVLLWTFDKSLKTICKTMNLRY